MSLDIKNYVPCLKWKQGEYQAVFRLSSITKNALTPLIEVPEIGYDFEKRSESKTIDEHLSQFAKRVKEKWGQYHCFVDLHLVESSELMRDGQHPFTYVFNDLRLKGAQSIPVIHLSQDIACQNAIERIVSWDKRGLCVRISVEEAARSNLKTLLDTLLKKYDVEVDECDFILDLKSPNFEPIVGFVTVLETIINRLPYLNKWRTIVLLGTSFPRSMAEVTRGLSIIARNEWLLYKSLVQKLRDSGTRIPTFGDYAINHPDIFLIDMRFAKPSASLRYTIDDAYLIEKGLNVRDHGFGQYRQLCREIVESQHYYGQAFSEGDKYINDCAQGNVSTGRLTTWRWVGTNHHMEKVTLDIANLSV